MDDQRKKIYLGHISRPLAEGVYCGTSDSEVAFTAPIDLLEGDEVAIDPRSGQPLAVYRDRKAIWKFEGEYYTASFTITHLDTELLSKLTQGRA